MSTVNGYIIFADIKGFSTVREEERNRVYGIYYQKFLPDLAAIVKPYQQGTERMKAFNTWGDGMMAVFYDGEQAVRFMIKYRDFFREWPFAERGMPKLSVRIAGHFGYFHRYKDPLIEQANITGEHVITSARIEPVTRPGEIYVTEPFVLNASSIHAVKAEFAFDSIGQVDLAKGFGKYDLYRLRQQSEKSQVIDRILRQDLAEHLPQPTPMTASEEQTVRTIKAAPSQERLRQLLQDQIPPTMPNRYSGPFILEVAKICKQRGLYEQAIEWLDILNDYTVSAHQIDIAPYRYDVKVLTLRTDCLSRLRRYQEAANLIYGAWQMNPDNSHVLSMLAAQYKRRALFGAGERLIREQIDIPMLSRAKNLYLEAFRRDLSDYYPAINAAYLSKMCHALGEEAAKGTGEQLAEYILSAWDASQEPDSWWLAISLAEAELLLCNNFEQSAQTISDLVATLNPPWFEKQSTREQIEIYGIVTGQQEPLAVVLASLQ
ncbi:MAG: adenylate/guanylate cyclase domain-containing protein [Magnetococcales bacterium]|nr:adenylate/guanylate cyclase domain-containing protein [Magnetococcales bacterium]